MNYPLQYIFVIDSLVASVSTVYADGVTITGPAGSKEYNQSPPNYAIQPGWKCTLDTLNNPTFSAP